MMNNDLSTEIDREEIYTPSQLNILDKTRTPKHVAFICDGNRRWAKQSEDSTSTGYQEGAENLIEIVKAGIKLGVEVMTFWIFSTENWGRSKKEVLELMWLLEYYLIQNREQMLDRGIRYNTIGDLSLFPQPIQDIIEETKKATAHCNTIDVVMAVNYGSRDEIRRAVQRIATDFNENKIKKEEITEKLISQYLDTSAWPDPDLLIRTSGELRLSNYLLWQISYSEIFISAKFWPDFTPSHLLEALVDFQQRERRFGV